jgi:hypothetical protein
MHFRVVLHVVIESDNRQFAGTVKDEWQPAAQPAVLSCELLLALPQRRL